MPSNLVDNFLSQTHLSKDIDSHLDKSILSYVHSIVMPKSRSLCSHNLRALTISAGFTRFCCCQTKGGPGCLAPSPANRRWLQPWQRRLSQMTGRRVHLPWVSRITITGSVNLDGKKITELILFKITFKETESFLLL